MEIINSRDNKKIKLLGSLAKAGKRKKEKQILIEGKKEILLAIKAGVEIVELFACAELVDDKEINLKKTIISDNIFSSLAYRDLSDGYLALAKRPENDLEKIVLKKNPLILVLESVEKPGNIGAMLRTADAVGADAVFLCDPSTDFYNPNVIRASLGAVFVVPVFAGSNEDVRSFLTSKQIKIYCAGLKASVDFRKPDYTDGCAIVIGTEHGGLSDFWLDNSFENILIPMSGQVDSLNASVSAAVILYEAQRQRGLI